jgi:hypothetical protein
VTSFIHSSGAAYQDCGRSEFASSLVPARVDLGGGDEQVSAWLRVAHLGPSRPHTGVDPAQLQRPDPWDRYLSELQSLPSGIKVLGINDYWFLDGYKMRDAFDRGDLPNLDEVFPVLEVRCDTFGGVDGDLSRLNPHMICDPGCRLRRWRPRSIR